MSDCTCVGHRPDHRGLWFEGKPKSWRCEACAVCGTGFYLHDPYMRKFHNIDHDYQPCTCKGDN